MSTEILLSKILNIEANLARKKSPLIESICPPFHRTCLWLVSPFSSFEMLNKSKFFSAFFKAPLRPLPLFLQSLTRVLIFPFLTFPYLSKYIACTLIWAGKFISIANDQFFCLPPVDWQAGLLEFPPAIPSVVLGDDHFWMKSFIQSCSLRFQFVPFHWLLVIFP